MGVDDTVPIAAFGHVPPLTLVDNVVPPVIYRCIRSGICVEVGPEHQQQSCRLSTHFKRGREERKSRRINM